MLFRSEVAGVCVEVRECASRQCEGAGGQGERGAFDEARTRRGAHEAEEQRKRAYAAAFRDYMSAPSRAEIRPESWPILRTGGVTLSDEQRAMITQLPPQIQRALQMATLSQP